MCRAPKAARAAPSCRPRWMRRRIGSAFACACQEQGRATAHGALWALDLRTGKIVGRTTYPIPNQSGMLSTDGDLVFTGHSTGRFSAYDADTIKEVWSFSLGTPITAPPMTFSVG